MARIHLVDDAEYIQQHYGEILSDEVHQVATAASGHQLMITIETFPPCPRQDGITT